ANALTDLGAMRRQAGDYPGAARDLEQALAFFRDLSDQGSEAEVLNEIGTLHRAGSELARAGQCHQQALELARAIASAWDEASADRKRWGRARRPGGPGPLRNRRRPARASRTPAAAGTRDIPANRRSRAPLRARRAQPPHPPEPAR